MTASASSSSLHDDDLFKLAEEAMMSNEFALDDEFDVEEDDRKQDEVVQLLDGSFHVCKGLKCPFAREVQDNERNSICSLTGRIVATFTEASQSSAWTGRSVGSADPDMVSAAPNRGWRGRRDAMGDSKNAYSMARGMTAADLEQPKWSSKKEQDKVDGKVEPKPKRGAPCVTEIDQEAINRQKRIKAAKRASDMENAKFNERAVLDAASIVQKIFQQQSSTSSGSSVNKFSSTGGRSGGGGGGPAASAPAHVVAVTSTAAAPDPRLENFDFVFRVGLKRYLKKCADARVQASLNEIHDVAIAASNFARAKRHESKNARDCAKGRMLVVNSRTVSLCATLIISIWNVVVHTTHFQEHTASDSFRPFAAGILYAFKRGIRLKDNTVVVPAIPEIANQLPTLRSSSATSTARQLQASSHRGLCAVHKSISSIDLLKGDELDRMMQRVKTASGIAHSLKQYVQSYMSKDKRK